MNKINTDQTTHAVADALRALLTIEPKQRKIALQRVQEILSLATKSDLAGGPIRSPRLIKGGCAADQVASAREAGLLYKQATTRMFGRNGGPAELWGPLAWRAEEEAHRD